MKLRKLFILLVVMGLIGLPVMVYAEGEESGTGSQETTGGETNPSGGESGGNESGQGEEQTTPKLDKESLELEVGSTGKLTVKDAGDKTVTWSSDKESVATVDNGTVTAVGEGTAKITADVDGTKLTCDVTVKAKEENKEIDYRIKKLIVQGATISPKFDKDIYEYKIQITGNVKDLEFGVELMDSKNAGYIIGNHDTLKSIKDNGIIIVITDAKGKTTEEAKQYKFIYEESETEKEEEKKVEEKNVNLASLKMTGYAFNEVFNKDVTDYTVMIPYEVTEITVDAVAEDKDAKVTISSTKGLDVGGNRVTVTVTNGDKKKVYNLYVTRSEQTETEEVPTSIIGPSSSSSSSNGSDLELPDVDDPDSTLNKITVTIASIVIFLMGAIGVYFFISTSPKRMKKEVLSKKRKEKQVKANSPMVEVSNKEEIEDLEPTKEIRRK